MGFCGTDEIANERGQLMSEIRITNIKRFILISPILLFLFLAAAPSAWGIDNKCLPHGDGVLSLYNYHLDESTVVTYNANGSYNQAGLAKIFHILRSPDGQERPIRVELIDIIDDIQDHFGVRTVEIISGYRSPAYNQGLKESGRRVARESLHMEGQAIDFHLDEVTESAIRDYATKLGCGGVGFYPGYDFIHIDTGPTRTWGENETVRKLVGSGNNPSLNQLETNQNDYFKNDAIRLTLISKTNASLIPNGCGELERFDRGKWVKAGTINLGLEGKIISPMNRMALQIKTTPNDCHSNKPINLPFGRYRIRLAARDKENNQDIILSNEFYLKKM